MIGTRVKDRAFNENGRFIATLEKLAKCLHGTMRAWRTIIPRTERKTLLSDICNKLVARILLHPQSCHVALVKYFENRSYPNSPTSKSFSG